MAGPEFFSSAFEALTGHSPLRWQRRMFQRLYAGNFPSVCVLPTGLGKTSVIPIWLTALEVERNLPRRLVYIVNRRTIVDQATSIVERMRDRLLSPGDPRWSNHAKTLRNIAGRLRSLAGVGEADDPLSISTLRGELADNGEWKINPARAAIVIGTVDMIGSKLLFSGYGDSRYGRAHHAGLIGHDALIIHDEAHLTPAFSKLLRTTEQVQKEEAERGPGQTRPMRVLELSATARDGDAGDSTSIFSLDDGEDAKDEVVRQRLKATKKLTLRPVEGGKEEFLRELAKKALEYRDKHARVLIYVRSPEDAGVILKGLKEEKGGLGTDAARRVCLLTGTIRGFERDRMVREDPIFSAFLSGPKWLASKDGQGGIYLVSTSAGEVGVDLDADHLVCDLTTLDSLAQRFGRVNRLGGKGRSASITLMYPRPEEAKKKQGKAVSKEGDKLDALLRWAALVFGISAKAAKAWVPSAERLLNTLEAVQQLPKKNGTFDASPRALRSILSRTEAFSPTPAILSTTDIVLDNWSLTSIKDGLPGRPEVEPYLHGLEKDLPETYVAWRTDVQLLADAKPTTGDLEEILDVYPVKPWERLRDSTYRVRKQLAELAGEDRGEAESKAPVGNMPAIIVDSGGRPTLTTIGRLTSGNGPRLEYSTIILPVSAGRLSVGGTLDPDPSFPAPESLMDVADHTSDPTQTRLRVLLVRGDDGWTARQVAPSQATVPPMLPTKSFEVARTLVEAILEQTGMADVHELPIGGDETSEPDCILLYLVSARNPDIPSNNAPRTQGLEGHLAEVEKTAELIGKAIFGADVSPVREALILAAKWHDKGKNRWIWQRAISNSNPEEPLAKSGRHGANWRLLRGYRHEFGSLHEAAADPEIVKHPECDLILHLIAAHHGWARPHFEPQAFDPDPKYSSAINEQAAAEVLRRYARLQGRFGRWGLAWLESLLRCADALASRQGAEQTAGPQSMEGRP